MSKQEEFFQEFQDIDKDPNHKHSYQDTYKLKTKFIKEEIQRCTEAGGYVPEVMKRANHRKNQNKKERKEKVEGRKLQRAENDKGMLNHFVSRQEKLGVSQSSCSIVESDMFTRHNTERILAVANSETYLTSQHPLDVLERQKFKNALKMAQAKELRKV